MVKDVLTVRLESITPVFCAGADQKAAAEIRPFSIRGALRWWYRALDGDFAQHEQEFFGGTGQAPRSSPFAVQLEGWVRDDRDYSEEIRPHQATERGSAYLGYTLYLSGNHRLAVREGTKVGLRVRPVHPECSEAARKAWAASIWLFGHLGGLGTRSRRGFGTLALTEWSGWPECEQLRPAHGAKSPEEWKQKLDDGFRRIREWFKAPSGAQHQHLGNSLRVFVWEKRFPDWIEALDEAGNCFRDFRHQSHIHHPEKLAAFGLPIRFRNHPARWVRPHDGQRAASRLHFRVIRIGECLHPAVWCAEGPLLPGLGAGSPLQYDGTYHKPYAGDQPQDEFLAHIQPRCVR